MKIKMINICGTCFIICCFLINGTVSAKAPISPSYQIIPRVRVGAITAFSSEAELKRIYGSKNVKSADVGLGEGETAPGTVVYPNDPNKRIEIVWKDAKGKRFPESVQLNGEKSIWGTKDGISLGTGLKELERINGKAFVLTGFDWDYAGTIVSWKAGKLEREFEKGGRTVLLRLGDQTNHQIAEEDMNSVVGDQEIPSGNKIMQRINPTVYQIIVEFP